MARKIPRRVPGGYFKPNPETVWVAPDAIDDFGAAPKHILDAAFCNYNTLVTHPCGMEMLREVRREWKKLAKADREATRG